MSKDKSIEESIKLLIYRYTLVPESLYFRREAAARIMRTAVKICKSLDDKWKNIPDSKIDMLAKLNSGELGELDKSKVFLKLREEYSFLHKDM